MTLLRRIKISSLKMRITVALIALVLVQGFILVCLINVTGALRRNQEIVYQQMLNQSLNSQVNLAEALNTKRKNLTVAAGELSRRINTLLSVNGEDISAVNKDKSVNESAIKLCLSQLIEFTKYNQVTGVFVLLDPTPEVADPAKLNRNALHIRDSSPGMAVKDNGNLLLEYGRVDLAREYSISAANLWSLDMRFDSEFGRDFYFNPVNAVLSGGYTESPEEYGYWSPPFIPRRGDIQVITYTLPLVDENGQPYGVMGFELDVNLLRELLPAVEIPFRDGFYLFGASREQGLYNDEVITSGAFASQFLAGASVPIQHSPVYESNRGTVYQMETENAPKEKAIGVYAPITLYDSGSPFSDEKWILVCLAPQASVMASSDAVSNAIALSIIATVLLALVLALLLAGYIFSPIRWLHERVHRIDPEHPVRFERIQVNEIDALSEAFEGLSDRVSKSAARFFKIIELVGLPLGSFEMGRTDGKVVLSANIHDLLRRSLPEGEIFDDSVQAEWQYFLASLVKIKNAVNEDGVTETLYQTGSQWKTKRWFRTRSISENTHVIGILMDVTEEIHQQQQLEFERDHDWMTKLYNRKAYFEKAFLQVNEAPDSLGVMIVTDIDDLKFINDQFGIETGDAYIKFMADYMRGFAEKGAIIGRISDDEFILFMNRFATKEAINAFTEQYFNGIRELTIPAEEGDQHRIRVSSGIAYYPEDSANIIELYKFTDYAMYEAKQTIKGEWRSFNMASYKKNYLLMNMKNILDIFIEEKQLMFAFQPIIDARTGEIYAYEALMRPTSQELKTPTEVLQVARSQSKLYQVEKLTFTFALGWLSENIDRIGERKLFINSIPGVILSDIQHIFHIHRNLASSVVFEISENEFAEEMDTRRKVDLFRNYGAKVAIDNYGSGYSNEHGLLLIEPDFVKIDMSFIRHIDKEPDKAYLVSNIVEYARKKRIGTIAEGVETKEEMETLINIGVDYIQGYYLGKPQISPVEINPELQGQVKSYFLYSLAQRHF